MKTYIKVFVECLIFLAIIIYLLSLDNKYRMECFFDVRLGNSFQYGKNVDVFKRTYIDCSLKDFI